MTFKKCKYDGCDVQVEMRNTDFGWRPFEESGNKHNCQFSEYAKKQRALGENTTRILEQRIPAAEVMREQEEQKNDHDNENFSTRPIALSTQPMTAFVDHTLKPKLKYRTITDPTPEGYDHKLNDFAQTHNIHYTQTHIAGSLYVAVVMYEELK